MNSINELARLFKDRDNQPALGIGLGNVAELSPRLKIQFSSYLLEGDMLILAYGYSPQKGDSVIVMPDAKCEKFYILGKAG